MVAEASMQRTGREGARFEPTNARGLLNAGLNSEWLGLYRPRAQKPAESQNWAIGGRSKCRMAPADISATRRAASIRSCAVSWCDLLDSFACRAGVMTMAMTAASDMPAASSHRPTRALRGHLQRRYRLDP